jgi:hypothetical protein
MIRRVLRLVLPYDLIAAHEKKSRHPSGVPDRHSDAIAFAKGLDAARPHRQTEQLTDPSALKSEGIIKPLFFIGNGARLGPHTSEKFFSFLRRSLIEKDHRRIRRIRFDLLA